MKRSPIVISKNHIALIQIFSKTDELLDVSIGALDQFMMREDAENAAKQFISQLKGTCSKRFFKALRSEIDNHIGKK